MPELPTNNNATELLIENNWEKTEEPIRPYLGYSMLGSECNKYIWLTFRWTYKKFLDARQRRLLSRGHQEERIIVSDLEDKGLTTAYTLDDQVGVEGLCGHGAGHPDGVVWGVSEAPNKWHLLEMKTSAEKYFTQIHRFGIVRAYPVYHTQANCYMGKMNLDRCLHITTNKNNDVRHYERLHFEPKKFQEDEEKGMDLIISVTPPVGISDRPDYYICKMCDAKNVCYGIDKPTRNCRTCEHSRIKDGGRWGCIIYKADIPTDFQRTGCNDHYKPLF